MSRNLTLLEFSCFWATLLRRRLLFLHSLLSMMSMVYLRKWSVMSVEGGSVFERAWVSPTKLSRDDYLLSSNEDEIALFALHFCQSPSSYANTLEIVWVDNKRLPIFPGLAA